MSDKVKVVQKGKWKHVIIKDVLGYWCFLNKTKKDMESDDQFYEMTAFVDEATVKALKKLPVNSKKGFSLVGKDVKTTGKNAGDVKFPTDKFELAEGLYGFGIRKGAFKKVEEEFRGKKVYVQDSSQPSPLKVMTPDGQPFTGDVGNGSKMTLKCYMKERDGEYNISLDTVVITDLVEYSGGVIVDDDLGVTYNASDFNQTNQAKKDDGFGDEPDDDDVPFDTSDDEDAVY